MARVCGPSLILWQERSGLVDDLFHRVLGFTLGLLCITLCFLGGTLCLELVVVGGVADGLLCLAGHFIRLTGNFISCGTHNGISCIKRGRTVFQVAIRSSAGEVHYQTV